MGGGNVSKVSGKRWVIPALASQEECTQVQAEVMSQYSVAANEALGLPAVTDSIGQDYTYNIKRRLAELGVAVREKAIQDILAKVPEDVLVEIKKERANLELAQLVADLNKSPLANFNI